jgi:hypothetical protein
MRTPSRRAKPLVGFYEVALAANTAKKRGERQKWKKQLKHR